MEDKANTEESPKASIDSKSSVPTSSSPPYVFLDHPTMLKKSKRKRTRSVPQYSCPALQLSILTVFDSLEDQTVLEAAYQKNSKPDKAERAAIVSQVQLNEKEVQVSSIYSDTFLANH